MSVDLGDDFRGKLREFCNLVQAHFAVGRKESLSEITSENFEKIKKCGADLMRSYSMSSTPIKAHYSADFICFKSEYYDFIHGQMMIGHSRKAQITKMFVIASSMLE